MTDADLIDKMLEAIGKVEVDRIPDMYLPTKNGAVWLTRRGKLTKAGVKFFRPIVAELGKKEGPGVCRPGALPRTKEP